MTADFQTLSPYRKNQALAELFGVPPEKAGPYFYNMSSAMELAEKHCASVRFVWQENGPVWVCEIFINGKTFNAEASTTAEALSLAMMKSGEAK